ncbi:MAG: hypothetical protein V1872_14555 [bacterium]
MGRYSWSDRNTVEDCKSIDIPWLARYDYFCGFKTGGVEWKNSSGQVTSSIGIQVSVDKNDPQENYIRFFYTTTHTYSKEKTASDYKIQLTTTPCNYGNVRYWFICPLMLNNRVCNRRVGRIYLPPNGKYFGCRHCYNLTYQCQKEHDKRVDALLKNPYKLMACRNSNNLKDSLLSVKASMKIIEGLEKRHKRF